MTDTLWDGSDSNSNIVQAAAELATGISLWDGKPSMINPILILTLSTPTVWKMALPYFLLHKKAINIELIMPKIFCFSYCYEYFFMTVIEYNRHFSV